MYKKISTLIASNLKLNNYYLCPYVNKKMLLIQNPTQITLKLQHRMLVGHKFLKVEFGQLYEINTDYSMYTYMWYMYIIV